MLTDTPLRKVNRTLFLETDRIRTLALPSNSEYAAKEGEKVTVHYTEEAGHKVVHFIKHM